MGKEAAGLYNREMGGIRSDGQLFGMDLGANPPGKEEPTGTREEPSSQPTALSGAGEGGLPASLLGNLLGGLKWDDLLIPAIALLLLSGDPKQHDLLILLVGLLLLF